MRKYSWILALLAALAMIFVGCGDSGGSGGPGGRLCQKHKPTTNVMRKWQLKRKETSSKMD